MYDIFLGVGLIVVIGAGSAGAVSIVLEDGDEAHRMVLTGIIASLATALLMGLG